MKIDFNKLNITEKVLVDDKFDFNSEDYGVSGVKNLNDIHFKGELYYNSSDELILKGIITGRMTLEDSLTLEDIEVPINIEIDENVDTNVDKIQNTLEIREVLWQNIVLEVPIRITKNETQSLKGEGWELKDDSNKEIDPRLAPLMGLLEEEKEN